MVENGSAVNSKMFRLSVKHLWRPSAAHPTFVSVFHELCIKFDFGKAMYKLERNSTHSHKGTFSMSLSVDKLGISVLGSGMSKKDAKHDAALKIMVKIMETTQAGGTLNDVPRERLLRCCEWMREGEILNAGNVPQPNNSAGIQPNNCAALQPNNCAALHDWLVTKCQSLPVYKVIKTSGLAHSRIFRVSCTLSAGQKHVLLVTEGEGSSIKVARNVAAEEMLKNVQLLAEDYYNFYY